MSRPRHHRAFSLVELMVAIAVTTLLIGLLASITQSTSNAWKFGSDRSETHATARGALWLLGRELQSAIIDLDLGYSIVRLGNNNYVLKFLTRRAPTEENNAAFQKVAYQLAWASKGLVPTFSEQEDGTHQIPVLIRTVNADDRDLEAVFNVSDSSKPWTWATEWDPINNPQDGDQTEVVAENVLGWEVNPIYYDALQSKLQIDRDNSTASYSYVDEGATSTPLYVTSDLKYVKQVTGDLKRPSDSAPRALDVRLAVVPTSSLPRLTSNADWANARDDDKLFDPTELPNDPLNNVLKKSLQVFNATYYLTSKTP